MNLNNLGKIAYALVMAALTPKKSYRQPTPARKHRGYNLPQWLKDMSGEPGVKLLRKAVKGTIGTCHGRALTFKSHRHGR